MLFNSFDFLIFFPVVTLAYFLLPHRFRWMLLLAASCYFYMAFIPVFILILAFTVAVDYVAGIAIENSQGKRRKQYLIASIIANVGVLFVFKYFNFFNQNFAALADFLHWNYSLESLALVLPIGLSFHTFQSLAYTIEVYRGRQKAERHFGIFALYVMFYPQLVAGPIERPQNLLHQFHEKHRADLLRIGSGLQLMVYGFFKKLFIADNLALFVNAVYEHPGEFVAPSFVIAAVLFAFQLYCDFSGYSDIAIGSARVMGIQLTENFRQPYFSRSIGEFWRRWHISLSGWFRDYFFTPLAHARVSTTRSWLYVSVILTFLVTGLWHGAGWTFVIMGALHGCAIVIELATKKWRDGIAKYTLLTRVPRIHALFQIIFTFMLVSVSWVFFRSPDVATAMYMIKEMFFGWGSIPAGLTQGEFLSRYVFMGKSENDLYFALAGVMTLLVGEYLFVSGYLARMLETKNVLLRYSLRWFLVATALLLIIVLSKTESQQFIYFQF
jgi:D-alanyl-lipoteichoic acid acyltransferase DltB (MBOAT superfamily)